ncbi:MAG: murein L,D-transpeptidase catalytic domain-containing protein [Verrucomicrobiota bacterium]
MQKHLTYICLGACVVSGAISFWAGKQLLQKRAEDARVESAPSQLATSSVESSLITSLHDEDTIDAFGRAYQEEPMEGVAPPVLPAEGEIPTRPQIEYPDIAMVDKGPDLAAPATASNSVVYVPEVASAPRENSFQRAVGYGAISEEAAKQKVIESLGGDELYDAMGADMSDAYEAARASLDKRGIDMEQLRVMVIIDFTKPSFLKRCAVYYPATGNETRHLMAHGSGSGKLYARTLSNIKDSRQSSPGLFQIGVRYSGSHGSSRRLHGLEYGLNDRALDRLIVMHSAKYVSYKALYENTIREGLPRLGNSWGCPVVSKEELPYFLKILRTGDFLYIHAPAHAFRDPRHRLSSQSRLTVPGDPRAL